MPFANLCPFFRGLTPFGGAAPYYANPLPRLPLFIMGIIEELETNSKINNIRDLYRGINDFKKGYQPRTIILKDEKGDLVAHSRSIMTRWKNYFSQLLNVHGDKDVR